MKVNSAKQYREWEREQEKETDVDVNFIGHSHTLADGSTTKGFFKMFHGKKPNIANYLPSLLDIAEDNQAIYEFLQNAVDCGASHFWAFYNDDYFLAVNNGDKFDLEGLTSILNIAQSTKHSATSIGRLGIGFKLAHRLVGKGNGVDELVYGNKGPIMFSWDKAAQLEGLMGEEEIECDGLSENAFLLKIAITNFPAEVGEVVRDVNYEETVVFPKSELDEMRGYVSECLSELFASDEADFGKGTLFFIKLGEGKRVLLDNDLETLRNGIEYSMNTLKQLDHICFNGEQIVKKELVLHEESISKDSERFKEIDPQYKNYDILYSFGFLPLDFTGDYYAGVEQLRQSPNFYKYFPMGDEVDQMALFVHCDSFQIEANRRKLINHHTNRELLPDIADSIVRTLNDYCSSDRERFLQLYAALLLTDKQGAKEKEWMNDIFFNRLAEAIKTCVPTTDGTSENPKNVKIKDVKMDLPLDELGLEHIQWFYWKREDKGIFDAAKEKLGVEVWNINDIIEKSYLSYLNDWLDSCSDESFAAFVNEIRETTTTNRVKELLPKLKLFQFGTERKSRYGIYNYHVITTNKIVGIKAILEKVGMVCTNEPIEAHPLAAMLPKQTEKTLFENIKSHLKEHRDALTPSEKLELMETLIRFDEIGEESIKKLQIFKTVAGDYSSLGRLVPYSDGAETWIRPYMIVKEESYAELQKYMVKSEDVFHKIVEDDYVEILSNGTSISELYDIYERNGQSWPSDLTIKFILRYGANEELLDLIEKTHDKGSVEKYIEKMDPLALDSSESYPESSYEYRLIQLAAKTGATSLRDKISIDGICLTDFSSSDKLMFNVDGKTYTLRLSEVLPDDTQCAIYGKVAENFASISDCNIIFSASSSNISNVKSRLQEYLDENNTYATPAQCAFILLEDLEHYYYDTVDWDYMSYESIDDVIGVISYFHNHGLMPILLNYKNSCLDTWGDLLGGNYLCSKDYTLESERANPKLERWCRNSEKKKETLESLGFEFDDCDEIMCRKAFKEGKMKEWDEDMYSVSDDFLKWVSTLKPITDNNQKKLLLSLCNNNYVSDAVLEQSWNEEDFSSAKELKTPKYMRWKEEEERDLRIFTASKKMPYRVVYDLEEELFRGRKEMCYKYFYGHLYIGGNKREDIDAALKKAVIDDDIPFTFEDYASICLDTFEEQQDKDRVIESLNEQVRQLKSEITHQHDNGDDRRANYVERYAEEIERAMGISLSGDEKRASHIVSRYRCLMYVKRLGGEYAFEENFDEKGFVDSERFAFIRLKSGKKMFVQGANWGIWYLSPNIWNELQKDNYCCLCIGNRDDDFQIVKGKEGLKQIANAKETALIQLRHTPHTSISDAIDGLFADKRIALDNKFTISQTFGGRDVHLMLLVKETHSQEINSLFDNVFTRDPDDFDI